MRKSHRNAVVFSTLLGALAVTSVFLLAISPPALTPDQARTLYAIDDTSPSAFDRAFQTASVFAPARWKYIYVHQSKTPGGDRAAMSHGAVGSGDHFVVGNGKPLADGNAWADGEIQITDLWDRQNTANPSAARVDPACISICVVGNLDQSGPTGAQLERLQQLVQAIQAKCNISAADVVLQTQGDSPATIGKAFPASAFRKSLLR